MENQRLLLSLALAMVVLLLWQAWQTDYGPRPNPPAPTPESPVVDGGNQVGAPVVEQSKGEDDVPDQITASGLVPAVQGAPALKRGERVRVVTDLLDVVIDTTGGDVRRVRLLKYPVSVDDPTPFTLLSDDPQRLYVAQSGFISGAPAPDHHAVYRAEAKVYTLAEGQDTLEVPLTWTSPEGVTVTKVYTFHRGRYLIDLEHRLENGLDAPWEGRIYRQFQRNEFVDPGQSWFIYTFTGGAVSTPEKPYEKIDFDEFDTWRAPQELIKGVWVAYLQHYFVAAWLPDQNELEHIYTRQVPGPRYILGVAAVPVEVPAGESVTFRSQLYLGPKEHDRLGEIHPTLRLTIDYGVMTFIAEPLFWLLKQFHALTGNWGWSIVLLTLLIKVVFYKLSEASYRSMANMRRLTPKLQALRERYGEDRQRLSQAMMELYRREKINPLSGCWPILVQIPVFLALYWVLLESVELRMAPWILWIEDLSTKDPYYVLPILMGLSMYVQQKLNPTAGMDPTHQKILQLLPIVFTLFFAFFPAGLVLYWLVNNTLSIAQQWYIIRKLEKSSQKTG